MNSESEKAVLACIDGSSLSDAVCDYAAWMAQHAGAPLKLIHIIDHQEQVIKTTDLSGSLWMDDRDLLLEDIATREHTHGKQLIQAGKAVLDQARQRVMQQGVSDPVTCLQHGSFIDNLVEMRDGIRTLVIGARGTGHEDVTGEIGSRLEGMIRSLHQPILVVFGAFRVPRNIMLAYNGSATAERALDLVASNPLYQDFTCHLVQTGRGPAGDESQRESLKRAEATLKASGVKAVISANLDGKPLDVLCRYQEEHAIDLTVMGAYSHNRLRDLLLGSFTTKMLLNTRTPLLLQR